MGLVRTIRTALANGLAALLERYGVASFVAAVLICVTTTAWFVCVLYLHRAREPRRPVPRLLVCTKCSREKSAAKSSAALSLAATAPAAATTKDEDKNCIKSGQELFECIRRALDPLVRAGQLEVSPVTCLSHCDKANCVAFQAYDRFGYHFAGLTTDDIEDLVQFTRFYVGDVATSAFTKKTTRAGAMRKSCVSRVPPLGGAGRDMLSVDVSADETKT